MAYEQNFDLGIITDYDYTASDGWTNSITPQRGLYLPSTSVTPNHVLTGQNADGTIVGRSPFGVTYTSSTAGTPSHYTLTGSNKNYLRWYTRIPTRAEFDAAGQVTAALLWTNTNRYSEFFGTSEIDFMIYVDIQEQQTGFGRIGWLASLNLSPDPTFGRTELNTVPLGSVARIELMRGQSSCELRVFVGGTLQADHSTSANYLSVPIPQPAAGGGPGTLQQNVSIGARGINWSVWPNVNISTSPGAHNAWIDAVSFSTSDWIGPQTSVNYPLTPSVSSSRRGYGILRY